MMYRLCTNLAAITVLLALVLSPSPGGCTAQEPYKGLRAADNQFVYDYAQVFGQGFTAQLNQHLVNFKDTTSNVIVVVTHPDFFDEEPWRFATDLGHAWGVSRKGKDNGIVIVVKPKTQSQQGRTHIAVGYGLEGAIPDAMAKRIVEGEMIPRFRNNDYEGGVWSAVKVLMPLAAGELTEYVGGGNARAEEPLFAVLFILFIMAIIFGSMALKAKKYAHVNNLSFWAAWMLLAQTNRRHSGHFGGFSGRSGGFGGGGGFGGFGGGGFGGGGAGGSW